MSDNTLVSSDSKEADHMPGRAPRLIEQARVGLHLALFILCVSALMVVIVGFSTDWQFSDEPEFRRTCMELGAEFHDGDRWMCIRDGQVVYP